MMKSKKIMSAGQFFSLFILLILIAGCDLQENPVDSPGRDEVFNSENGIEKYINSFYSILPSAGDITHGDEMSDYASLKSVPDFLKEGVVNPRTIGQWNWDDLRKINYFLVNNTSSNISEGVRNNYSGIARFYRAWFYFEKVKRYGKVPWIDKPLNIDSEELTAPRDSRADVMQHVLDDLNFAIDNISTQNESSRTKITRDVALALKSRITLFEGTYRKYHDELGLGDTASEWLQECVSASKKLMDGGTYSIYMDGGVTQSYRALFTTESPIASEVLLSDVGSTELAVRHDANWWYTSGTYGAGLSFIRPFINTYLMRDGTPYTDQNGYKTESFNEEVQNRDARLQQTIRMGDYTRDNGSGTQIPAPPNFSYTFSGYQPIKWTLPDISLDAGNNNTNSVPVFRYAEILLNYAEVKAELGTITNKDWQQTVGRLRERADIENGTSTLPTKVDTYLQQTYFPDISDPVLLEIRRERGIELALEGFRFDDIRRWKRGELMEIKWTGIYVDQANTYMDLNDDGNSDVYFYTDSAPDDKQSGVNYVNVGGSDLVLTDGDHGRLVRLPDAVRTWSEKKYLYPLALRDLQKNKNLKQNPSW